MFLLAASKLNIESSECLVVEDADTGGEATLAGGMKVLAVGYASNNLSANIKMKDLQEFTLDMLEL